ncbi:MAG: hypothetical protein O9333_18150 [Beijerinckiaceae bacterium]|jgi:hypothetical protein|nr:hypothetical protein [Beijerinckiaceae bacterium]
MNPTEPHRHDWLFRLLLLALTLLWLLLPSARAFALVMPVLA